MSQPFFLNKYEKEKRVIEMHLAGKTIREIAKELHMSFTPISKIIKAYERKITLQAKRNENNQNGQIKKPSKCSQAYQLFLDGNNPVKVAIDLSLNYIEVRKYWTEFLQLNKMKKLYHIYIENEYHLDYFFRIYYFMLRNEIPIKDCEDVLRAANDVINLNKIISNLKNEIERLKQMKNNYTLNQNIKPLLPLGLPEHYYRY